MRNYVYQLYRANYCKTLIKDIKRPYINKKTSYVYESENNINSVHPVNIPAGWS